MTRMPTMPLLAHLPKPQQRAQQPDPPTEEERRSLMRSVLGGVAAVGGVLDLPGSSVRDVLAGENPLDQWASPFRFENRVTGRELLERLGLVGRNRYEGLESFKHGGDLAQDVLGFGAEVALDPLTWISGPLGTPAKVAEKAGQVGKAVARAPLSGADDVAEAIAHGTAGLAKGSRPTGFLPNPPASFADQIRQGDRGVIGIRNPFTGTQYAQWGAGNQRLADLVQGAFYGSPTGEGLGSLVTSPLRAVRAALSPGIDKAVSGPAQLVRDLSRGYDQQLLSVMEDMVPALLDRRGKLFEEFGRLAEHAGKEGSQETFTAFLREGLEARNILGTDAPTEGLGRLLGETLHPGTGGTVADADAFLAQSHEYLDGLMQFENTLHTRLKDLGLQRGDIDDFFVQHFGRRGIGGTDKMASNLQRKEVLTNYPTGTRGLNEAATRSRLTGLNTAAKKLGTKKAKGQLRSAAIKDMRNDLLDEMDNRILLAATPADEVALQAERELIRKTLKGGDLEDRYLMEVFVRPAIERAHRLNPDFNVQEALARWTEPLNYVKKGDKSIGQTNRLRLFKRYLKNLPEEAREKGLFSQTDIHDWMDYMQSGLAQEANMRAVHDLLKLDGVVQETGKTTGLVPLQEAWTRAGFTLRGIETLAGDMVAKGLIQSPEDIAKLGVSVPVAKAIRTFRDASKRQPTSEIAKWWDRMTALYRGGLTTGIGPLATAFHTRNQVSGLFQAWSDGKVGLPGVLRGFYDAARHLTGGKPLEYLDEIKALDIVGHGYLADVVGEAGEAAVPHLPGHITEELWRKPLSRFRDESGDLSLRSVLRGLDPTRMRGVRAHPEDVAEGLAKEVPRSAAAEWGENAYKVVEFINRAGYYTALRRKGFTPGQAKHYVRRSQFDYNDLNVLEKQYARRLGLFYGWKRKSVPYTLLKIFEHPGGVTSQTIRAASMPQRGQGDTTIPSFLRERLGARWGPAPGGETTFLMQGGLPIEDLNQLVLTGSASGSLRRMGEKQLSDLAPAISAPLEWITGKQFYTGRPIQHLASRTGVPVVDRALAAGPWSRAISEVEQGLDPRKSIGMRAANLLTGLKFGTYDTERWETIDTMEAIRRALNESPWVREYPVQYVPEKFKPQAGEGTQQQLRRMRELQAYLKKMTEEAKKEG